MSFLFFCSAGSEHEYDFPEKPRAETEYEPVLGIYWFPQVNGHFMQLLMVSNMLSLFNTLARGE